MTMIEFITNDVSVLGYRAVAEKWINACISAIANFKFKRKIHLFLLLVKHLNGEQIKIEMQFKKNHQSMKSA